MTLEDVCAKLEHVLEVRPVEWWGWIVKDHVRLLVAHGRLLIDHARMVFSEFGTPKTLEPEDIEASRLDRFAELVKRAEEVLRG